jgi:hypothetical protein
MAPIIGSRAAKMTSVTEVKVAKRDDAALGETVLMALRAKQTRLLPWRRFLPLSTPPARSSTLMPTKVLTPLVLPPMLR